MLCQYETTEQHLNELDARGENGPNDFTPTTETRSNETILPAIINSGIYKITNRKNGRFYIGSTKNLARRKLDHFERLREERHVNKYFQREFSHGNEEDFFFEIVERVAESDLIQRENYYLNLLFPYWPQGYNIADGAGGGDFKFHPDRERIYKKYLENNLQDNNPFHGRKHSSATLEKMSIAASKRKRGKFSTKTSPDDIVFVMKARETIASVKGIVRSAQEHNLVLGRTKVKKILDLIKP